ncbi:uncharacterized protein LMH87_007947 [Akanthomyces muscarius]|uniref:6-methylsalicylate decarboxylase n=1 Tax=Akanthomyces muscarius TaxID=2231603 RepID=A0A9W8QMM6_AKAMU|nr:uncharacterized protein LMH87_007947 [Akanthomyces muscarius]KAJ4160012.1 hypothetical protein LMH87_007947 [Akanthomyces muscarius]
MSIDVHHHVYPPVFTKKLNEAGGDPSGWFVPDWTLEADQDLCKAIGVKTAILSVTAPGTACTGDPTTAATLARECNEYVAAIRDRHADAYGFFAVLPSLIDTDACLKEIAYGLDHLHADGVIVYTRYGDANGYLGHAQFRPIWEELNRRKVVVFVHPTHSVDTALINSKLPQPMFDYPHETGRTAIDLITSGALREYCQDCKIILSHAGGTLPALIGRVAGLLPFTAHSVARTAEQLREDAKMFYFDTALSSDPATLAGLVKVADPSHILFGSDFPNAPNDSITYFTKRMHSVAADAGVDIESVCSRNALKLFPRLNKD